MQINYYKIQMNITINQRQKQERVSVLKNHEN
jgi:hypothetical protein